MEGIKVNVCEIKGYHKRCFHKRQGRIQRTVCTLRILCSVLLSVADEQDNTSGKYNGGYHAHDP